MQIIDLSELLKDYEGKWVAISDDNSSVYGSGITAKEAVKETEASGHFDYSLLFVRPFDELYCGLGE